MIELPCKRCISYALCKAQYRQERHVPITKMTFATKQFHAYSFINKKCSIIHKINQDKEISILSKISLIEGTFL